MTKNKKEIAVAGLTAAVAAVAAAQSASAADPAPVEEYAPMWDGIYIGAAIGIMDGDAPFSDGENDYEFESDVVFGAFIGLNHQFENDIVVGAELAVQTVADIDQSDFDSDDDYEVDYVADAKFKVGYAVDNFLPYIFGGISGGTSQAGYDDDYGFFGVNYGVGVDWKVTENFSIGAEVLGRTIFDPYHEDEDEDNESHYQGMLRAAFHF